MRALKLTALLVFAVLVAGCVPSLHPLYTEKDLVFDKALVGTWSGGDESGDKWVFKEAADKAYDLTITSDGEPAEFEAHLVRLGKTTFLDTYPKDLEGKIKNTYCLFHLLPVHTFWKLETADDVLRIVTLDPDGLKTMIDEKKAKIGNERVDDGVVLTAPTKELQAFLEKHAGDDQIFAAPMELKREKPEADVPASAAPTE